MKKLVVLILLTLGANLSNAQNSSPQKAVSSKPFVLGVVDEIRSKELGENRILNIYLPEGYNAKDSVKYPVIYLLDGSADEDFIHVAGLVQFYNFEWVNVVPKAIVVGIATVDRKRDFTFATKDEATNKFVPHAGGSAKFMAFIEKELQPYMASAYKTSNDKTIIGQSLGGLLATEILLKNPLLFNRYIIISPSLWYDHGSLLNLDAAVLKEGFKTETQIYVGVGKEGLTPLEPARVMEVDANLLADKLKTTKSKDVNIYFDYLPLENHATIMHQALINAFPKVYPASNQH